MMKHSPRLAVLWEASDSVDVNFSMDYTKDGETGPGVSLTGAR